VSNSFKIADVKVAGNGKVSFKVKVPGPGYVAVLETAPSSNIARTSKLSAPHGQFAFGRTSKHLGKAGTDALSVSPSAEGRKLLAHHRSTVKIKLWVEFTPTGGRAATHTVSGLRVPG
jgi:hypothetical protein